MAEHTYAEYGIGSQCIHAGLIKDEYGSAAPAIYQTSTFSFKDTAQGAARFAGKEKGYIYSRMSNPTTKMLEDCVAALEGGYGSMCAATGMGAVNVVFLSLLKSGDHVVMAESVYGCTHGVMETLYPRFGIECTFVDASDVEEVRKAMKPNTKMVYVETPGNPTMAICDLTACAKIAHDNKAYFVVDNTFMSPILQKPLQLGADVVVHSVTKFINGHSDVVGGIVVTKTEELYKTMKPIYNWVGVTMDPHQAWMVLRGIKTLKLRVLAAQENAKRIADILVASPAVSAVHYAGVPTMKNFDVHAKQAMGPGSLMAFEVKGGVDAGSKLISNLKLFTLAVSLGGVETLIQLPASMTHACMSPADRLKAGISDGLIRLSVGCEDGDDLCADLKQALAKLESAQH